MTNRTACRDSSDSLQSLGDRSYRREMAEANSEVLGWDGHESRPAANA